MTVLLASYPRSGNTWMRVMLEEATGRHVASVSHDMTPGSKLNIEGEPLAVKTHFTNHPPIRRAIWLIRNPYDALASYYRYRVEIDGMTELTWDEHFDWQLPMWYSHTEYWYWFQNRVCIRYEDMIENPGRELVRALDYIEPQLAREVPLDTVKKGVEAGSVTNMRRRTRMNFMHEARSGYGKRRFTTAQQSFVREVCGRVMGRHGYEP